MEKSVLVIIEADSPSRDGEPKLQRVEEEKTWRLSAAAESKSVSTPWQDKNVVFCKCHKFSCNNLCFNGALNIPKIESQGDWII